MSNLNPAIIASCNAHKQRLFLVTFADGTRAAVFAYTPAKASFSAARAAGLPSHEVIDAVRVWGPLA